MEGGTLRFSRALSLTDQGVYVCNTTNEVGSGRAEILITISGVYPTGNPSPRLKCNAQCCHLVKTICNCIFTFMHLADAFIQIQIIQAIHFFSMYLIISHNPLNWRNNSYTNEDSVTIYSPSCRSKPAWYFFYLWNVKGDVRQNVQAILFHKVIV